jgi:hypothetical protein
VAADLGVRPDDAINIMDFATAHKLGRAMMRMELGYAGAALVTDAELTEGLRLAGVMQ